jgi:hypothetical protein
MWRSHIVMLAVAVLMSLRPASAAEPPRCLTREQQRAAIADGRAVPLGSTLHAVQRRGSEVVKARLCEEPGRLIYLLTVLARDGKVRHAIVDAANGAVVGER